MIDRLFYQQYNFANTCSQGRRMEPKMFLRMIEKNRSGEGLANTSRLFVSMVAALYCFFIRLLVASDQKPKGSIFGSTMSRKRLLFRVTLAQDEIYDSAMRRRTYAISIYRYDLRIYDGSRGQKETFVGGNGVPRNIWR